MVGHNAIANDMPVETLDGVAKLVSAISEVDGQMLITTDHGNVEKMRNLGPTSPYGAHRKRYHWCMLANSR